MDKCNCSPICEECRNGPCDCTCTGKEIGYRAEIKELRTQLAAAEESATHWRECAIIFKQRNDRYAAERERDARLLKQVRDTKTWGTRDAALLNAIDAALAPAAAPTNSSEIDSKLIVGDPAAAGDDTRRLDWLLQSVSVPSAGEGFRPHVSVLGTAIAASYSRANIDAAIATGAGAGT